MAFLVAQMVKNLPVTQKTQVQSLGQEHPLEKGMAGWNSLQSKGLSRVFSNTTVQKYQFFGA